MGLATWLANTEAVIDTFLFAVLLPLSSRYILRRVPWWGYGMFGDVASAVLMAYLSTDPAASNGIAAIGAHTAVGMWLLISYRWYTADRVRDRIRDTAVSRQIESIKPKR